ncbi:MAG: accessory regulator AgrB [Firmicutes bacterium]|nr:accessory regulator AgrB [Bacillota bacterium]
MSLSFSKRWAGHLAKRTGQSDENEAVLAYVIEVLIINLLNITVILTLGFLFNVLPEIITCMVTIALLRFTAGGAHSNNPWRCAAVTAFVFLAIALIASYLSSVNIFYLDILSVLAILFCFFSVIRFAPVDSPSAPILSATRRKRLKYMSLLIIFLLTITIIFLQQTTWIYAREILAAMILCTLWGSFNLTGAGHRLMSFIDNSFTILSQKRR